MLCFQLHKRKLTNKLSNAEATTRKTYIKNDKVEEFKKVMSTIFGDDSIYILHIRNQGCVCVIK